MSWNCDTKYDVIELFKEAENPLSKEEVLNLNKIDQVLKDHRLSRKFIVDYIECLICGFEEIIMNPKVNNGKGMKCTVCGGTELKLLEN